MDREIVQSDSIAEVGYDPELEILEIMFRKTGQVYQYLNFPAFLYERFRASDSLGRFFNFEIRGNFPESKA